MWVLLLKVTVGSVTAAFLFSLLLFMILETFFLYRFKSGTSELLFLPRSDFLDSKWLKLQQNALVTCRRWLKAHEQRPTNTHTAHFHADNKLDNATRSAARPPPRFHTTVVNSPVTVNTCNFSRYVQCFCMKSDREAFVIFFFVCLFLF